MKNLNKKKILFPKPTLNSIGFLLKLENSKNFCYNNDRKKEKS